MIRTIDYKQLTFKETYMLWSFYEYLRNNKRNEVKRKNRPFSENYITAFRKHTVDLHEMKMEDITMFEIQELIDDCDYGYTTRRYIKQLSKTLFKFANSLFHNCYDISLFEYIEIGSKEESKRHKAYRDFEKEKLWDLYLTSKETSPILDIMLIGLYTTLRPTALLQVETAKVFLDEGYLKGGIKSVSSIDREIPIHPRIKELIEKRFDIEKKYLFTDSKGEPYSINYYQKEYRKVMRKLGLYHVPYDNRKSVSTELKNKNVDPLIIKKLMGHSIKDVTEKYYIEITLQQKKDAVNLLS